MEREVIRNESRDIIVEGMFVALLLEIYCERSFIGRVDELKDEILKIIWFYGYWTISRLVCKRREG